LKPILSLPGCIWRWRYCCARPCCAVADGC
jgi:hypothetical protein